MNRRNLLKAVAGAWAIGGTVPRQLEGAVLRLCGLPDPVGVVETPHLVGRIEVYLDGHKQRGTVLASVSEGRIVRYVQDANGLYKLTADREDVERETVYGDVRVEWIA